MRRQRAQETGTGQNPQSHASQPRHDRVESQGLRGSRQVHEIRNSMIWSSAISKELETRDALAEVVGKVKAGLGGKHPDALFVFVSPHHSDAYDELLERLNA